jgi:nitronate monooxygenase
VRETKKLTERPFGVNIVLQRPVEDRLTICLEEGACLISFSWGNPAPWIKAVHAAGSLVMHTVGSAAEAKVAVDAGVDIVLAQGWEAGGHVWGQVATLPLVPPVVDAVRPLPVVAAGGIADGRGIAAVLALGASGAALGTRFLATDEAAIHPTYKEELLKASEADTIYSCLFDRGWPDAPHRAIRNSTVHLWEKAGCPGSGNRPREGEKVAAFPDGSPVLRYSDVIPTPGMSGDLKALALYAGQGVGLVSRIKPASQVVRELAEQAVSTLRQLYSLSHAN